MPAILSLLYIAAFLAMATTALVAVRRRWSGSRFADAMRSEAEVPSRIEVPADHPLAA